MEEGNIRLCVVISSKTDREFRACIYGKHGYKKGDLSKWHEIAIRNFIREQQQSAENLQRLSSEEKEILKCKRLMQQLGRYYQNEEVLPMTLSPNMAPFNEKVLIHGIKKVRDVTDDRTARDWIDRLLKYHFIQRHGLTHIRILNDGYSDEDLKTRRPLPKEEISEKEKQELK